MKSVANGDVHGKGVRGIKGFAERCCSTLMLKEKASVSDLFPCVFLMVSAKAFQTSDYPRHCKTMLRPA